MMNIKKGLGTIGQRPYLGPIGTRDRAFTKQGQCFGKSLIAVTISAFKGNFLQGNAACI